MRFEDDRHFGQPEVGQQPRIRVASREYPDLDTLTCECDYPHSDSNWPESPEIFEQSVLGLNDHEIAKVTHLNAMRHFHDDPFTVLGYGQP